LSPASTRAWGEPPAVPRGESPPPRSRDGGSRQPSRNGFRKRSRCASAPTLRTQSERGRATQRRT